MQIDCDQVCRLGQWGPHWFVGQDALEPQAEPQRVAVSRIASVKRIDTPSIMRTVDRDFTETLVLARCHATPPFRFAYEFDYARRTDGSLLDDGIDR